jgi:hypothetical protein
MKKALIAMVCTLGVAACAENRPAEDPSTVTTITTTETTTTGANTARRKPAATSSTPAPAPRAAPSPADGYDATRPLPSDSAAANGANRTDTGAPVTTGAPGAVVTDNPGAANGTKDADNTKINDRDRHGALTPMDQGGGNDRDITAAIRRAVVGDKALSFTAKNVKIITVGGKVTLRGPVKSDEEKSAIEAKAKSTTGVSAVDNQLEVKK